MVGLKSGHLGEPEIGYARQNFALARNAIGQDAIKGGYAVGSDEQKPVTQVKYLAHFAAFEFAEPGQLKL